MTLVRSLANSLAVPSQHATIFFDISDHSNTLDRPMQARNRTKPLQWSRGIETPKEAILERRKSNLPVARLRGFGRRIGVFGKPAGSEEHTSELQSRQYL